MPGHQILGQQREVRNVTDFMLEICKGNIPGHRVMRGLGERESVGITINGEDVTRLNELSNVPAALADHTLVPFPDDAGEQMSVISESAEDNPTGTGTGSIRIEYLDAGGFEQEEVIIMNGTTAVDLVASDARFIQAIHSETLGSGNVTGVTAGHIRIYKTSDATLVYNMIAGGGNMSLLPHRMVPCGKTLHLKEWIVGEGNNKRLTMRLRADCTPQGVRKPRVFIFKSTIYANQTTGQIPLGYSIPEFSVVKVTVWASAINGEVSVHWWGILVDKVINN